MDPCAPDTFCAVEVAVTRLLEDCCRGGPLYQRSPRLVAQVSRTARWHLNAIAHLRKALDTPDNEAGQISNSRGV